MAPIKSTNLQKNMIVFESFDLACEINFNMWRLYQVLRGILIRCLEENWRHFQGVDENSCQVSAQRLVISIM